MYYAGLGSRNTPKHVLEKMSNIAYKLDKMGFKLSSGHANGADYAFEKGAYDSSMLEGCNIYLPWDEFNSNNDLNTPHDCYINASELNTWEDTKVIVKSVHPYPDTIGKNKKAFDLHRRNAYEILGKNLLTPVKFMIYYAEWLNKEKTRCKGGTNTALQLCLKHDILTFNLFEESDKILLDEFIKSLDSEEYMV